MNHFQFHLLTLHFNRYNSYGFQLLNFDDCTNERSLFAVLYSPEYKRIWIDVLFFQFKKHL